MAPGVVEEPAVSQELKQSLENLTLDYDDSLRFYLNGTKVTLENAAGDCSSSSTNRAFVAVNPSELSTRRATGTKSNTMAYGICSARDGSLQRHSCSIRDRCILPQMLQTVFIELRVLKSPLEMLNKKSIVVNSVGAAANQFLD